MSEMTLGLVSLIFLLIMFASGIELGIGMIITGFLGFVYINGIMPALNLLGRDFYDVISSYSYTVFPLFILMGQIGYNAGLAAKLYDASHRFVGHVSGGLAMATVFGAVAFKTICGSATATTATLANVAIPEMDKYKYNRILSTGLVATVGGLGCILPPSVVLIAYGMATEQSIGKLFLAGLIPGLITAFLFLLTVYFWVKVKPDIAPKSEKYLWVERIKELPSVVWILSIFLLMLVGITAGFFTPTEAGAIGAFLVFLLVLIQRTLNFKLYIKSLKEALKTASMLLMLFVGSAVFGHFLNATYIPQELSNWIIALHINRYVILLIVCLGYLLGGTFVDDLAFMILATPIFYPIILKLGFNLVWFGIVVAFVVMIGSIIPPVAICIFVVNNISKEPIGHIYKGVVPFLGSLIFMFVLLLIFPEIALWLPSLFY